MNTPSRLSDEERADLVAYLDGELKGEAARTIEERLSRDETVREEAAALKRTWELLDFLPTPEPSPNFTHRTLSNVRPKEAKLSEPVSVVKECPVEVPASKSGLSLLLGSGWIASLLLSVLVGFFSYGWLVPIPPEEDPISQVHPEPGVLPDAPATDEPHPTTFDELPLDVRRYVNNKLWPMLPPKERTLLISSKGSWPLFEYTLRDLAGQHPYLEPLPDKGPFVKFETLPEPWKKAFPEEWLRKQKRFSALKSSEGRWPNFALAIADVARSHPAHAAAQGVRSLPPLGACRPKEFPLIVQSFLDDNLTPLLSPEQAKTLKSAEGKWPEYPRALVKLARYHHLSVPSLMMPEF